MEVPPETSDEVGRILRDVRGNVEFRNVDFSYDPNRPLIQNFNLQAKAGQKIANVGPTGAGKSTIINLLMRYYDVDAGAIYIDGVDIREVRRDALRTQFAMVLQETWSFDGTVRENIAYGKEDATEEEIRQAAKRAYADAVSYTHLDVYKRQSVECPVPAGHPAHRGGMPLPSLPCLQPGVYPASAEGQRDAGNAPLCTAQPVLL